MLCFLGMARQYITTAIDYPNAAPHMGHVLEKVLADVCARWFRMRGDEVRFQIGTDEHGIKIQRTAEGEGVTPEELVDRNVVVFQELYETLQISADDFIRTSDQQRHWPTVQALWSALQQAGALEKRSYTGLYCSGCERFMTERDLEDGVCPNHQVAPEEVTEENWFFLLGRDGDWLRELLTKGVENGGYQIEPEFRSKETLSLIDQGLEDVSFSRPRSTLEWGVPVPGDDDQVMYVWCDALTNYISTLGILVDGQGAEWWDDARVTHVIGKDITRFHALIWPAMLKGAGVRTPDHLLVHGFLTSEGQKMSKSTGNVVVPQEVIDRYGVDALRFYLSHEVPVGRDGDFSWQRFSELYDAKLRNALGNLLNRVLVLLQKEGGAVVLPENPGAVQMAADGWKQYAEAMDAFRLHDGIQQAMQLVDVLNAAMDQKKPWTLEGDEKTHVLSEFAETLRHIALLLLPFVPETAQRMSQQLGVGYADQMLQNDFVVTEELRAFGGVSDWTAVGQPEILFAPVEDEGN